MESSLVVSSQSGRTRDTSQRSIDRTAGDEIDFAMNVTFRSKVERFNVAKGNPMTGRMPPVPPANRSNKGVAPDAEAARDTSHKKDHTQNTDEQGETANIKQNTTNAGFFKGRRVK
jgi:hypothetical protein